MEAATSPPPPQPASAPSPPPCSTVREVMVKGREMSKKLQILLPGIFRAGDHQAAQPPHCYSSSSSLKIKTEPPPPPPPPHHDDDQEVLKVVAEPTTSEGILHLQLAAAALVGDILRSFTQAITILDGAADNHHDDNAGSCSCSCSCCCKSTNTTTTSAAAAASAYGKKKLPPAGRDGRGTYKRRRTDDTWTKETTNLDDGYGWRKYGQKAILGTNHPRSYFRCTHKYEQGCEASKQVQLKEDGSGLHVVTYMGHHTCCRDSQYKPSPILIIDTEEEVVPNYNNYIDKSAGEYVFNFLEEKEQQHEPKMMSFSFTTTSGKQLELMKKSSTGSSRTATHLINHNICSTSSHTSLSSHDQLHDHDHNNNNKYLAVQGRVHDGYHHKPAVNIKEISMSSDEGAGENMVSAGVCSSSVSSSYNYMQEADQDNSATVDDDSVSIQDILINFDDHEDWFFSHTF
ncbi:hypothetical protein H6P81_014586 [Aristolochia fimbriata]|uniref:WRKY domain-containing protein n=1 Tax=Aristolochia fimbriata TaxID=158543 RepID=A0AAV7E5W1_ARIFI|nr:hypothetical protein H6P81_014586 [Aristolochia fimbriata]